MRTEQRRRREQFIAWREGGREAPSNFLQMANEINGRLETEGQQEGEGRGIKKFSD